MVFTARGFQTVWCLLVNKNYAQIERQELCDLFESVGPDHPTLCEGWTAADLADAERVIQSAQEADKYWAMPAADGRKFEFACQHNALFVTVTDDVTALKWGLDKGLSVAGL